MSWINPLEAGDTHTSTNSHTHTCTHGEAKHTHTIINTHSRTKKTQTHTTKDETHSHLTPDQMYKHTHSLTKTHKQKQVCAQTHKNTCTLKHQRRTNHIVWIHLPQAHSYAHSGVEHTQIQTRTHTRTHLLTNTHTHTRTNTPSHSKHTKNPSKSNGSIRPKLETHPCSRKPKVGADHHCDPLNNVREIKLL